LSYLSSPGGTTERLHIYIGLVDASDAKGVHGLEYESEDILVHRVPSSVALDWINEGKIDNAASLIALQWFAMNKQQVLEKWSHD
jgi:ADP-ribose pyrophosphatase